MSNEAKSVEELTANGGGKNSANIATPGYKFPEALLRTPRCLIALSGLDVRNNAVHRLVWEEFTAGSRRADRKPILYKHFPANHIYATAGSNSVSARQSNNKLKKANVILNNAHQSAASVL